MEKERENEILEIVNSFWVNWFGAEIEYLKKNLDSLKEAAKYKYKGEFIIPCLNKDKIRKVLRGLKIDNETLKEIISTINPPHLSGVLIKDSWINSERKKEMSSLLNFINQQIKELSPLIAILKKHHGQSPLVEYLNKYHGQSPWASIFHYEAYPSFIPLTIKELKFKIEVYREIKKFKQEDDKRFNLRNFEIDNLKKSPQKYKMWNGIVFRTIKILNPYCHNENCYSNCKKTHKKTYMIMAKLLKIIYPKIWKGKIDTITNRIKQKDYRQL